MFEGAAEGLGDLDGERAVEPLIELVKPGKGLVVQAPAMEALANLKDPRAVGALRYALNDSALRSYARTALQRMGGPEAERALAEWQEAQACGDASLR